MTGSRPSPDGVGEAQGAYHSICSQSLYPREAKTQK
jgi:hypothetical protein